MSKGVVFQTETEEYAIPIQHVVSIEKMQDFTVIPAMPSYMKGVTRIREELVPVIDMNQILFNRANAVSEKTRIVVVHDEELAIGLIVDDAKEIIEFDEAEIKQLSLLAYKNAKYFIGIANFHDRLITLLDPCKLFAGLEGIREIKSEVMSRQ